jgi:hypothetical protein
MTTNALGWDNLFFSGSIVDLDINIWSARLSVRPADLGIEDTAAVREALGLGIVRLAPHKAFERLLAIRRAALKDVENSSFNFPFIRGARYVPEAKVERLLAQLDKRQSEFFGAINDFSDRYNFIRAEMIPVIRKALLDAACENIEASLTRIEAEYPKDIVSCFGFSWKIYGISGTKSSSASEAIATETEQVKGVIREIVVQLRSEFSDKVSGIASIIARGGRVPTTSIASCREVLDRVKTMNVFGDSELTNQVRAFERILALSEVSNDPKDLGLSLTPDINKIQKDLNESLDAAIANAEKNLTGLGNRRISL